MPRDGRKNKDTGLYQPYQGQFQGRINEFSTSSPTLGSARNLLDIGPVKYLFTSCLLLIVISLDAQRDTLARYGPGFRFQDGIYLDFQDFEDNCPSYRLNHLRYEDGQPLSAFDFRKPVYAQKAPTDSLTRVFRDSLWGYASNGQIFLQNQGYFDRLVVIGSICHIIHREEVIDYNPVYGAGAAGFPVRREIQVEYMVDMKSGDKMVFDANVLLEVVSDDPIIFRDFERLSNRQRKQSKYLYLHRYNREHPVYFPLHGCRRYR